jgi:hypothetical protein
MHIIALIMKNRTLLMIIFGKNNCLNQSETSLQKKTLQAFFSFSGSVLVGCAIIFRENFRNKSSIFHNRSNIKYKYQFNIYMFYRIQDTFKLVKEQRDELLTKNRDSIDSPKPGNVNEEIRDLKTELKRQKAVYEAQFIEYVSI